MYYDEYKALLLKADEIVRLFEKGETLITNAKSVSIETVKISIFYDAVNKNDQALDKAIKDYKDLRSALRD